MSNDTELANCFTLFQSLALQCERMNAFARSLRDSRLFSHVHSGTDLRLYESGWAFEKYVEAPLGDGLGLAAVWWLELSEQDGSWKVQGTTSISHGDFDEDVEERTVSSISELAVVMQTTVLRLIESFREGNSFRTEIDRLMGCAAQEVAPPGSAEGSGGEGKNDRR